MQEASDTVYTEIDKGGKVAIKLELRAIDAKSVAPVQTGACNPVTSEEQNGDTKAQRHSLNPGGTNGCKKKRKRKGCAKNKCGTREGLRNQNRGPAVPAAAGNNTRTLKQALRAKKRNTRL